MVFPHDPIILSSSSVKPFCNIPEIISFLHYVIFTSIKLTSCPKIIILSIKSNSLFSFLLQNSTSSHALLPQYVHLAPIAHLSSTKFTFCHLVSPLIPSHNPLDNPRGLQILASLILLRSVPLYKKGVYCGSTYPCFIGDSLERYIQLPDPLHYSLSSTHYRVGFPLCLFVLYSDMRGLC